VQLDVAVLQVRKDELASVPLQILQLDSHYTRIEEGGAVPA